MLKSLCFLCLILLAAPSVVLPNNFAPISNAQLFEPKEIRKDKAKFQILESLDFLLSPPNRIVVQKTNLKTKTDKSGEKRRRSE